MKESVKMAIAKIAAKLSAEGMNHNMYNYERAISILSETVMATTLIKILKENEDKVINALLE